MNMSAQMIDHQDAVKSLMAERYLLGELNASEREAYEEHLFSCDACFDQFTAAAVEEGPGADQQRAGLALSEATEGFVDFIFVVCLQNQNRHSDRLRARRHQLVSEHDHHTNAEGTAGRITLYGYRGEPRQFGR